MARILVTGASRGIGRATVLELAARGHEVVATARSAAALDGLPAAARVELDVTDQASVDRAVAAAAVADALELADPPLRIPVGAPAKQMLAARHAAPDNVPFLAAPLDW